MVNGWRGSFPSTIRTVVPSRSSSGQAISCRRAGDVATPRVSLPVANQSEARLAHWAKVMSEGTPLEDTVVDEAKEGVMRLGGRTPTLGRDQMAGQVGCTPGCRPARDSGGKRARALARGCGAPGRPAGARESRRTVALCPGWPCDRACPDPCRPPGLPTHPLVARSSLERALGCLPEPDRRSSATLPNGCSPRCWSTSNTPSPSAPVTEEVPEDGAPDLAGGFSLHAGTVAGADERGKLAPEGRKSVSAATSVARCLPRNASRSPRAATSATTSGRPGATAPPTSCSSGAAFRRWTSSLDTLPSLPKPRVNLTRFHGVFAPNSRHRAFMPSGYA